MGLDYGSKTVGVAVSDALMMTAQPLETVTRESENKLRKTLARIAALAKERQVGLFVLGRPLHMDGNAGERVAKCEAFRELLDVCYKKEWVPHCKKTFDGAESVIRYLGKYTHRIAISNCRIKSMTDVSVTFAVKDYKNKGQWTDRTISGEEFIRRFLMHVPPKHFVRIRHYGILSSRNKACKVTLCRNLLGCKKYISRLKALDAPGIIRFLYGRDICKCTSCGGRIIPLSKTPSFSGPLLHMLC